MRRSFSLLLTAWYVTVGVQDILHTNYLPDFSASPEEECVADGERDIVDYRPYACARYSSLEGLGYLSTEGLNDWYNVQMTRC